MGKTLWRSRTVTDTLGTAGGIVLDDEDTARAVLEDWLHDYYEYMQDRGEPVTKGPTSVSLGMASQALGDDRGEHGDEALAGAWWRCGDEADVEIAAEYLYAAAYEN